MKSTAAKRWLFWLALLATVALSAAAVAATGEYQDVRPDQGSTEATSASLHVTLAYGAIWVVAVLYLVFIWRRQARIAAEIAELRRRLDAEQ